MPILGKGGSCMLYDYIIANYEKDEPIFLAELPGQSEESIRHEMKRLTDEGKVEKLYNDVYVLANNINAYLLNGKNVFIESRTTPICNVPQITKGCQPTDGGHLNIEREDYEDFIAREPNAKQYHFGVLTSNVHMAWTRAVCGRLREHYRYSKNIVYNNFPWPSPTEDQKATIEKTAQAILDARALYPDCSLADLYDETLMPIELRKAHIANDRAVMQAYGFSIKDMSEADCVAALMELYQQKVAETD